MYPNPSPPPGTRRPRRPTAPAPQIHPMAPPTLLTPLPPGAPPPPMPRPSAAALAAYRPDVPVLAPPLPQCRVPLARDRAGAAAAAAGPAHERVPAAALQVLVRAGRLPQRLGLPLRASGGGAGPVLRSAAAVRANAPGAAATDARAGADGAASAAAAPAAPQASNDGSFLEAMKRKLAAAAPAPAEEEAALPPAKRCAARGGEGARRMKKKAEGAACGRAAREVAGRRPPRWRCRLLMRKRTISHQLGTTATKAGAAICLWSATAEAAALKRGRRGAPGARFDEAEAPPAPAPSPPSARLRCARDARPGSCPAQT